jgi:hypothetical protein
MAEKNTKETIKRYAVLALGVVFLAVGYYRLFYEKKAALPAAAAAQPEIQLVVPEVKASSPSPDGRVRPPAAERRASIVRDIFSPAVSAAAPEKATTEKEPGSAPATFTLKGTIVAGNRPIAIINGRFVRTGDWIDGYQVVKIGKRNVWLESAGHVISVDAMPYE